MYDKPRASAWVLQAATHDCLASHSKRLSITPLPNTSALTSNRIARTAYDRGSAVGPHSNHRAHASPRYPRYKMRRCIAKIFLNISSKHIPHHTQHSTPKQHALQSLLRVRHHHMALSTHQTSLLVILHGGVPESTPRKRIEELASAYGEVMKVVCPCQNFEKPTLCIAC